MPKKKTSAVFDYFDIESAGTVGKKKAICKVEDCNANLMSSHATNLKSHLKSKHRKVYDSVQIIDSENVPSQKKRPASEHCDLEPSSKQPTLTELVGPSRVVVKSIKIKMDKDTFEKACVTMVTKGGCPFRLISSSGFKLISDPITEALNMKMDEKIVREKVWLQYKEESRRLKELIKGKLIYLKLDLATRLDRSFLGINIQLEHHGELLVYNLKVLDISGKSTNADALTTEVIAVLNEFDIDKTNVLSITTDNGGNVMKISKLLSPSEDPDSDSEDINSDEENTDEDDIDIGACETNDVGGDFVSGESGEGIEEISISDDIMSTKCAAHTLDLAADDVVKIRKVQNSILKLKTIVKVLRTKNFRQLPLNRYNKKPILENATRWGSTYDMVKCALDMKDGILEWGQINSKLKLSSQVWHSLEEFVQIMEPVRSALLALQKENLTPGDFYHTWLKMKHRLQKLPETDLSRKMLERIEVREANLIEKNPLMIAGIYCDIRFTALLSPTHIRTARSAITNVVLKLHRMANASTTSAAPSLDDEEGEDDEFELYLRAQERDQETSGSYSDIISEIEKNFSELERLPRLKKATEISFSSLKWWQERKGWAISQAAMVLTCLPATQVSVERLFSALANVLTDKRNRLRGDILDAVLFLRLNLSTRDSN